MSWFKTNPGFSQKECQKFQIIQEGNNRKLNNVSSSHLFLSFFTEICQLRLDFTNFDIVETTLGVCTDSLTIAGPTGRNPMDLCGTLTGMHGK